MLSNWDTTYPGLTETVFGAATQLTPSHLADASLFDVINLSIDRRPKEDDSTSSQVHHKNVISGNGEPLLFQADVDEISPTKNQGNNKENDSITLSTEGDQIGAVNL
jgi:hypothetical protein